MPGFFPVYKNYFNKAQKTQMENVSLADRKWLMIYLNPVSSPWNLLFEYEERRIVLLLSPCMAMFRSYISRMNPELFFYLNFI